MSRQISPPHPCHAEKRSQALAEVSCAPDDADARARFERAYPKVPATPVLRDVQHALAREYGHESWAALTKRSSSCTGWTAGFRLADARRGRLRAAGTAISCSRTTRKDASGTAAGERALSALLHVRRSVGRNLAPHLRVPPARVQGRATATSSLPKPRSLDRAGRRLRQLGRR